MATPVLPLSLDTPVLAPPIQYATPMGTRWEKEKAAAGSGAFEYADDPKLIGPWILGHTVGKGASGRVKIARHARTGQLAAVKILPIQPILSSRASLRTQQAKLDRQRLGIDKEIIMMKLMDHPNIMRIYDVFEGDKELFLVLEYVEGGELFDFLVNRGRLPPLEALAYFKQITYGLAYAHAFSIIHRDLKPENILIHSVSPPLIKIADWGMAAFAPPERQLETSCGSPHYASPEIVNGIKYQGTATDIWSCGVILFALLTGRLPFDDKNVRVLLGKVRAGKYEVPEFVDPLAKDLLARMLVVNVDSRITMTEILAHPWMSIRTPGILYVPAPPLTELDRPLASASHISGELLECLRIIWGRRPDVHGITADLLSPPGEGSLAKAFYFLLQKNRQRVMEENGILMDLDEVSADGMLGGAGIKQYAAPPVKAAVREILAKIQEQTPRLSMKYHQHRFSEGQGVHPVHVFAPSQEYDFSPLVRSPGSPAGPRDPKPKSRQRLLQNEQLQHPSTPPRALARHRTSNSDADSYSSTSSSSDSPSSTSPSQAQTPTMNKKRAMTLDIHNSPSRRPHPVPVARNSNQNEHQQYHKELYIPAFAGGKGSRRRTSDAPPKLSVDLTPAFTPRGTDSRFFRNSVLSPSQAVEPRTEDKLHDQAQAQEEQAHVQLESHLDEDDCVSFPSPAHIRSFEHDLQDLLVTPLQSSTPIAVESLSSLPLAPVNVPVLFDTTMSGSGSSSAPLKVEYDMDSITYATTGTPASTARITGAVTTTTIATATETTTGENLSPVGPRTDPIIAPQVEDPELQHKLDVIAKQLNDIAVTSNQEVLRRAYNHPNDGVMDLPSFPADWDRVTVSPPSRRQHSVHSRQLPFQPLVLQDGRRAMGTPTTTAATTTAMGASASQPPQQNRPRRRTLADYRDATPQRQLQSPYRTRPVIATVHSKGDDSPARKDDVRIIQPMGGHGSENIPRSASSLREAQAACESAADKENRPETFAPLDEDQDTSTGKVNGSSAIGAVTVQAEQEQHGRPKPRGPRSPAARRTGLGLDIDITKDNYVVAEALKEKQSRVPLVRRRTRPRPMTLDFVGGPFGPKRNKVDSPFPSAPTSPAQSGIIRTPVVSEVKGWFSNLFNWKTQTYTLYSAHSPLETRDEAIRIVRKYGLVNTVIGELPSTGVTPNLAPSNAAEVETVILKCRVEEAAVLDSRTSTSSSANLNKQVRFRIEISTGSTTASVHRQSQGWGYHAQTPSQTHAAYAMSPISPPASTPLLAPTSPPSRSAIGRGRGRKDGSAFRSSALPAWLPPGCQCAVTLVLEKGSVSAFRAVYMHVEEEWKMDVFPLATGKGVDPGDECAADRLVDETLDGFVAV